MSKIVYELPITALTNGYDEYIAGGGQTRMFLTDHSDFKRGDLVYWFDPEEKIADFAFINDFKVNGVGDNGMDISFILHLRGGEEESLKVVTASLDDIVKIVGVISADCNWLENEEEIEDAITVALFAVPVGQPTIPVEGDDEYVIIPNWRVQGVDSILQHQVVQIYNEHCFHYH